MLIESSDSEDETADLILPVQWQTAFAQTRLRRRQARLSTDQWAELVESTEETLLRARAPATWRVLATVHNQFRDFQQMNRDQPAFATEPLDRQMMYWLQHKINAGQISRSTPYKYSKILYQLWRQSTGRRYSRVLTELQRSLIRNGHNISVPKTPAELGHIQRAMTATNDPTMRYQLMTMWLLAARADDVTRLSRRDLEFHEVEDGTFVVQMTWNEGTKAGARPLVDYVILPQEHAEGWRAYVEPLPPDARPFPRSHQEITTALRQGTGNNELTSHSIKKGALICLIDMGYPLAQVAMKAKHRDIEMLRVYIGEQRWSIAMGLPRMAQQIAEAWAPML